MGDHARTTPEDAAGAASRTTLEELLAEPGRVAGEAVARPVHIDGPDGVPLVLLSAAELERLRAPPRGRAMKASEMSEAEVEEMLAQPIPPECSAFDDEVPEGWLDAQR